MDILFYRNHIVCTVSLLSILVSLSIKLPLSLCLSKQFAVIFFPNAFVCAFVYNICIYPNVNVYMRENIWFILDNPGRAIALRQGLMFNLCTTYRDRTSHLVEAYRYGLSVAYISILPWITNFICFFLFFIIFIYTYFTFSSKKIINIPIKL